MQSATPPLLLPTDTSRFVGATTDAAARDPRLLSNDLRDAISREELRLIYQPLGEPKNPNVRVISFRLLGYAGWKASW
jgi:hypothetical protein